MDTSEDKNQAKCGSLTNFQEIVQQREILRIAEGIYQQAFRANNYFQVMKQYRENIKEYRDEMRLSPVFYNLTYDALMRTTTMELTKIYEENGKIIGLRYLKNLFKRGTAQFPTNNQAEFQLPDGTVKIIQAPHIRWFRAEEIELLRRYPQKLVSQKVIERVSSGERMTGELFNGLSIEMTINDYVELFEIKLDALKSQIDNLHKQRIKIYAHNDCEVCFDIEKIEKEFPITIEEIYAIIEVALEISKFAIAMLQKVVKPDTYVNVNDMKSTLEYVRLGRKYQRHYIQELMQEEM